jgi:RNA polymerase sigma factor (TIGR02999 family)
MLAGPMSDVTRILAALESGDPSAAGQLLPLVYDELRKLAAHRMAHEAPGHTLQGTALVHEAYLRLVGDEPARHWDSRGHFFAAAAEAMRRILVENARRKQRHKHGGGLQRLDLDDIADLAETPAENLLALDEALTRLAALEPHKAELVKLRFFAGCSIDEAAEALGISRATAKRDWAYARAWLYAEISEPESR